MRGFICAACRRSEGIELVRQAKREGLPVTADVAIHHVHLIDVDIGYFDPNFRLDPPLRGTRDRDAIVAGLADGTIDIICSDHAPIGEDDKLLPFGEAEPGASALETLLPLTLKWANENNVPLVQALAKITSGPARILGKGSAKGQTDSRCKGGRRHLRSVLRRWVVSAETLISAGKNTPFAGYELEGRVRYTLVGGEVRYHASAAPMMRWLLAPLRAMVFSAHVLLGVAIVIVIFPFVGSD